MTGNDWPEVIVNLQKVRKIWTRLSRILGREGVYLQTSGCLYLAIVQAALIFVADNWVTTLRIGRLLGGFHHRADWRILGKQLRRREDGT